MDERVHPLAWRAILAGQPWVMTKAEDARYRDLLRGLFLTTPRWPEGVPRDRP